MTSGDDLSARANLCTATAASVAVRQRRKCARPPVIALVLAFNEEGSLPGVLAELRRECSDWSVVVVNDGSTDETAHCARTAGVPLLELPYNAGVAVAEQTGFLYARALGARFVVRLDGDGQHPAAEARRVVAALEESEADVVIGSRFLRPGGFRSTFARRAGIRWLSFLLRAFGGLRIADPTSGLRAFGERAIALLSRVYPHGYPEPESILLLGRAGLRVEEVPVTMRARDGGRSSLRGWSTVYYPVKVSFALLVEALRERVR
ncbi:MAG: glycosyltransferase family 2 protein [Thermoanaerobaculia bacterium]|nr:glycosyltransferase family 2 protein [Thermoanaerobaculia bacterium]